MDPALVKKYRAQFRLFDSDRSGSLEEGEIKALILSLGIVMNDSEITKMLDDNDKDGDRQLDEEEFILMITKTPSLTKKMNIGKTRIKDPKRSLNTRVELLEQHQHKNVAVVKRIEHLMKVMSEQLANSTKENQEGNEEEEEEEVEEEDEEPHQRRGQTGPSIPVIVRKAANTA